MTNEADTILNTWFVDIGPNGWFAPTPELDELLRTRFLTVYDRVALNHSEINQWLETPSSSMALVLLLDQFPRNMFRGQARSFATDALAVNVARRAIEREHDVLSPLDRRVFYYLPFEHSENLEDQELAVKLVRERANLHEYLAFAEAHRDIIQEFGRFPHRNGILGRENTPEEQAFLESGGATFGTKI